MRHRHLDRVLQELVGFHVTVQMQVERIRGNFRLYSNAIELLFSQPYVNHRGSHLTSFILFKEQMGGIDAVFRFHDELTPRNQLRRLEQIERARNPSWFCRVKRGLRNFMVAFREAISESIGLMASRLQQRTTMALLKGTDGKLQEMGNSILDIAGNAAYDPVLEHYIFSRVVFESTQSDGEKVEYLGILEEYSSAWVSIVDCYLNTENELSLTDASRLMIQRKMDFEVGLEKDRDGINYSLKITNTDRQDITLRDIQGPEEFEYKIEKVLRPGKTFDLLIKTLPQACLSSVDKTQLPIFLKLIAPEHQGTEQAHVPDKQQDCLYPVLPELSLTFLTCRGVDVYLPRSRGLLRHASESIEGL